CCTFAPRMKNNKKNSLPILGSQLTATVSVALVLLVLGIVSLIGIAAKNAGDDIRSRIGFVVILSENATDADIAALKSRWAAAPYVAEAKFADAELVLKRWNETMSADGDSITELLGVNPFFPEFEVAVKSEYADAESLEKIVAPLRKLPGISEIKMQGDMVRSINATVSSLTIILSAIALALLLISFVLINNTVRLTVYARRFSIHTMKLVGATAAFIRRPFVISNIIQGVIAAFIAVAVLAGILFYAGTLEPQITASVSWMEAAWVFVTLFVVGVLICTLSALLSTNRYLRLGYDDMF
ncbi:MAG: permease-like cell division protein FtsX, partial [Paramuribaculum sp.]|nr:permease-like cell division protein FtsX [Paramuribaculum sp.]